MMTDETVVIQDSRTTAVAHIGFMSTQTAPTSVATVVLSAYLTAIEWSLPTAEGTSATAHIRVNRLDGQAMMLYHRPEIRIGQIEWIEGA
jgi:hypothetical protein